MSDLYGDAFAALPIAAAILDAAGRVAGVNPAFTELAGRPATDLTGKAIGEFLEGFHEHAGGRCGEHPVFLRLGDAISARMAGVLTPLAGGGALLTLRPAPDLARWPCQTILEAIGEGVTIRDQDGCIIASNSAARALLGPCEPPKFVRGDGSPLPPCDHPARLALDNGCPLGATIGVRQQNGCVRWLHVESVPICHPDAGRAVVSSFTEVSQLMETQRRLADSERRFRAIFHHTYEFIGLLTTDGRLIEANATALAFIDKRMEDVVGQHFADTPWWTHSPADQDRLRDGIAQAAAGRFVRFETSHPGADGSVWAIDFSLKPVSDETGQVVYIIPEGRDISHIKRAERELMDAKIQAEAANSAKSAFLAAISHELRTPLNAVIGFSEIILQEILGPMGNPRYTEYVELIHTAGSHLRDVIEDILDVARIETGELSLRESHIDLHQCLTGALDMVLPKARDRQIGLMLDLPPDLPRVRADALRLRQIVLNLLSNAVKFTPPGGAVRLSAAAGDSGLSVSVADTGIGIRPEDMDHIWLPFFQAEATLSRRFGGTGLGLPIVRHYVEAHGGTISVASTPGAGATFTLHLPAERVLGPVGEDRLP